MLRSVSRFKSSPATTLPRAVKMPFWLSCHSAYQLPCFSVLMMVSMW